MSGDPRDTLVVLGGAPTTRVDTRDVRAASLRLADAGVTLAHAAGACLLARSALDRALWTPTPWGDPDPGRAGRLRQARTLAADAADAFGARSRQCTSLADRLLVAAGLYARTETVVEQMLGGIVTGGSAVIGFVVAPVVAVPVVATSIAADLVGFDELLEAGAAAGTAAPAAAAAPAVLMVPDGGADLTADADADGTTFLGGVLRTLAPYADEAVAGAGFGVSFSLPLVSRGDYSVTGGARVLSAAVDSLLPQLDVAVERVADDEFTSASPGWSDRPAVSVAEALARMADLYPEGNGIPGREVPGTPDGTIAVEQIVSEDGAVSWTVLIPGTQDLVSMTHPFDVDTDLDLMAGEVGEIAVGVMQALADAGADPDEPVVLVGHSLGGIAATALAASPWFRSRHTVGGVVTAGAPTATFQTPPGVPVLHLENTEELVSPLDGRSSNENPATVDRVTVGRRLADSTLPADVAASGSITGAHQVATHLRTLEVAAAVGSVQVAGVTRRIESHLDGERAETRYYRVRRVRQGEG